MADDGERRNFHRSARAPPAARGHAGPINRRYGTRRSQPQFTTLPRPCVLTPYRGKNKPESQKQANRAHARLRSPGERANAQLKTWRILRKLRCCPWRAGQLAKAIHTLQIHEAKTG